MILSQTAEHALRAVLFLARQPQGERVPADAIAEALGAPRNYLAKTLGTLAKAGVITGARGPTGGFRLEVAAEELTLARVVEPFEELDGRGACLEGGRCDPKRPCGAHNRWAAVQRALRAPMENTVVADLMSDPSRATRRNPAAA